MHRELHIEIHYDKRGTRAIKTFTDFYASRRFYIAKHMAGKNPKVVNPNKIAKEPQR